MVSKGQRVFTKLNLITIITTLVVILAGALVRSTGAGMGCPDWPKCFGQYIPPTSVDQLPPDYKQKYVEQRVKKNQKFADLLVKMGKDSLANRIRNDQSILVPENFNATKTWTEYINRLTGAITGIFLLATAIYSFSYRRKATRVVALSVLNVLIVCYQAWLGSIVVSTNLTQWVVTAHMLLALLILAILIYNQYYVQKLKNQREAVRFRINGITILAVVSIVLTLCQIILGTHVREVIDMIARNLNFEARNTWILKIGEVFSYHRDLALLVLGVNIWLYKMVNDRLSDDIVIFKFTKLVLIVIVIQLVSGFMMSYFALPPMAQVIHVLFSTILFSIQFYLFLLVRNTQIYHTH